MKSHAIAPVRSRACPDRTRLCQENAPLVAGRSGAPLSLLAQGTAPGADADKQTIQMLLQRIERLEARVEQLEGTQAAAGKVQTAGLTGQQPSRPVPGPAAGPAEEPDPLESGPGGGVRPRARVGAPGTGAHGYEQDSFAHPGIRGRQLPWQQSHGDTNSFALGQLNLFVTSDISEKFKFLGEIVFESGPDNFYNVPGGRRNEFGVDVERYLVQYSYNDYFNLAAGRYHTAIGFYNTAYHHSTWFQTTTGRPLLFEFEDSGGILPIHNVGLSASGRIPSGALGLHYVAEIGNGRASRQPLGDEPVQNVVDENNYKAVNLALFARPESIRGLQIGFSGYHDKLMPFGRA